MAERNAPFSAESKVVGEQAGASSQPEAWHPDHRGAKGRLTAGVAWLVVVAALIGFANLASAGGLVTNCGTFGRTETKGSLVPGTLAAALSGGGDVSFACSGTIIVVPEIRIEVNTRIDAAGNSVTLSGNNQNPVFRVSENRDLDLYGIKITGGAVYGGLRNMGGRVELRDCEVSENSATIYGGGILNENRQGYTGTINLLRTKVERNKISNTSTNGFGAGIYNRGRMTLTESTVSGNVVRLVPLKGSYAAGIHTGGVDYGVPAAITIIDSSIEDNESADAAGIYNNLGSLTLIRTRVYRNLASSGRGGGIKNFGSGSIARLISSEIIENTSSEAGGGIVNSGMMEIISSTIRDNSVDKASGFGGGIFNTGTLSVNGSTFSSNNGGARGGAIENFIGDGAGQLTMVNSTLFGNRAESGGGIRNYAPLTLINVTLADNEAREGANLMIVNNKVAAARLSGTLIANGSGSNNCQDDLSLLTDGGHNIEDGFSCGLSAATSLSNIDPLLGDLADNGGETKTMALPPESPAAERIALGVGGCGKELAIDQRGVARPQGAACDVGAYEVAGGVDEVPPRVMDVVTDANPTPVGTEARLSAIVDDTVTGGSAIEAAEYRIGDQDWAAMSPSDGAFDDAVEGAEVTVTFPAAGLQTVCVRGRDAFGNVSSPECTAVAVEGEPAVRGDLNADGMVNGADVELLRGIMGKTSADQEFNAAGDLDGDGRITINDLRVMRNLL